MDCIDCWQDSVLKIKVYICEIFIDFQKLGLADEVAPSVIVNKIED